jgi:hypothetical protein
MKAAAHRCKHAGSAKREKVGLEEMAETEASSLQGRGRALVVIVTIQRSAVTLGK